MAFPYAIERETRRFDINLAKARFASSSAYIRDHTVECDIIIGIGESFGRSSLGRSITSGTAMSQIINTINPSQAICALG
ncbi:MAG: hypothetical protein ABS87_15220 [Sphingomonas sp. SCN 67-18]|nr:MAG: hypothetical protein ABS87_15220 [Sphingomonas sp. SCN 67-18]